jgi:hypothetical protein
MWDTGRIYIPRKDNTASTYSQSIYSSIKVLVQRVCVSALLSQWVGKWRCCCWKWRAASVPCSPSGVTFSPSSVSREVERLLLEVESGEMYRALLPCCVGTAVRRWCPESWLAVAVRRLHVSTASDEWWQLVPSSRVCRLLCDSSAWWVSEWVLVVTNQPKC